MVSNSHIPHILPVHTPPASVLRSMNASNWMARLQIISNDVSSYVTRTYDILPTKRTSVLPHRYHTTWIRRLIWSSQQVRTEGMPARSYTLNKLSFI
jgi:hypothetical protein